MEECLALLESLEQQNRDVGDFSQSLTILEKIDQALKKLSSQSEAGSVSLTEEQRKRLEENRKAAAKRRLEKSQKSAVGKPSSKETSSDVCPDNQVTFSPCYIE